MLCAPPFQGDSPVTLPRIVLLLSALAVPAGALTAQGQGPAEPEPITLDVMTFNIRTSAGRDGENNWLFRKELVAETIGRANPHLLGMQEALGEQIEFLEEALPQYRWLGVDRGLNGGTGLSEATPIFYRHEELIPVAYETFWLGDPPRDRFLGRTGGRGGSRIVTWARFHHVETGQQIYVYNTHFTLREGPRQVDSTTRINQHIAALPPGSALIVMGDFNAVAESSETWRLATSEGLRDAWTIAPQRHGPAVTSNGFGPPPSDWQARIDWILVGGPIDVLSIATVIHSVDGRYPSDHYPVLATLRVRAD
jgi:endonuclease/exonuclease/phosphatase family metal-dependent hydrolase